MTLKDFITIVALDLKNLKKMEEVVHERERELVRDDEQ